MAGENSWNEKTFENTQGQIRVIKDCTIDPDLLRPRDDSLDDIIDQYLSRDVVHPTTRVVKYKLKGNLVSLKVFGCALIAINKPENQYRVRVPLGYSTPSS